MKDGETVDTKVVSRGTADGAGRFALSLDEQILGDDHITSDGQVDIELRVNDGQEQVSWNFTVNHESGRQGDAWENPRIAMAAADRAPAGKSATHLNIDLGKNASVTEEGNEPETWVGENGEPLAPAAAAKAARVETTAVPSAKSAKGAASGEVGALCTWRPTDTWYRNRKERFVTVVGSSRAPVTLTQEVGNSHTLGIGIKGAASRTWSQSGTASRSFGASSEDTRKGAYKWHNRVNYRQYRGTGCSIVGDSYQIRPVGYYALGTDPATVKRPKWTSCTPYSSGTRTKTSGRNATFSTGVDTPHVSLSAQSGWSKSTKMSWKISGKVKLCGNTKNGWASSPQAGAYNR
ncbi:hypothetical protein GL263_10105 [Streptomyces durbertensis]|uniref:Uncharacterized protein n=1 Tax=Streptomyces durbertensis TaxID=2448886 RepID=A0ABR6EF05_9ACTN|nr:hypothetical protein [Streptomyces durbertensis]MBB1243907.1 hypothetical protein [Streptomyces durbertensis]